MNTKKYALVVLSILMILLVFLSTASAADTNKTTEVLSVDESSNIETNLLSADNNVKSNDTLKVSNDEVLTAENDNWYVNSSKTDSGNGTSDVEAFKSLKEALDKAENGDTIMIASGEYTGTNNTGLTIDKNLTFIKYGDGEAIFDAESQNRIWYVNATSINITDITFKNGKARQDGDGDGNGGALYFENSLINSNINATFINNTATEALLGGGAIYIYNNYSGNLTGTFINNTASYYGGAIYCYHLSSNLTGTFINNTVSEGGAIYIASISGNISGTFINNTAHSDGGAIFIFGEFINPTAEIKDAIFINNNIYSKNNTITAVNCWFGNNATNYNATPDAGTNVTLPNWLFLNATADTAEVPLGQNSTITFKLDSYNSTSNTTNSYDASKINAAVSLTQTLGALDKTTALFDENIIYTAKKGGKASITGKFETLAYTINLKNTRDSITWYVNGSKTSSGNGTSDTEAFKTLKEALNETIDYDTIMIASGEYKGTNNTELTIDKNLTIMKYGDGEAIFDAESQRRIWYVPATSINITGITFKNGNATSGGALHFEKSLTNSNINATFINNNAKENGGAIRINGNFSGNISGIFINNTANHAGAVDCGGYCSNFSGNLTGIFINNTAGCGGAIDFYHLSGNISGTFINNRAKNDDGAGGAIYIYNTSGNISGTFINNTDKDGSFAIFIYGDSFNPTAKIKDAVFINNKIKVQVEKNKITATDCWFGNNATNYNQAPNAGTNVNLPNWLFLNATASPGEIKVNEKSTINFILESYDNTSKNTSSYDASKMNIILDLNQTLGELDKTKALINNDVKYTAKNEGNASVTGKFETAFYTINLKNDGVATPTNITLNISSLNLVVGENGTIVASLNPPEAGNLTYTSNDTSIAEVDKNGVVTTKGNGSALITVSFAGNEEYAPADNKTVTVTVTKPAIPTNITLNTTSLNLNVGENGTIIASLNPPEAGNLTYSSNDTNIATVDKNGIVTAKANGTALITVSFPGNKDYAAAENKTLTVTVGEKPAIPTNITLNTTSLNLIIGDNGTIIASLNPPEAGNLTYTSNDTNIATVDKNGTVTAKANGTALITVSFSGNGQYLPAENKTVIVTVGEKPGPIPTNITLNTTSLSLIVGENGTIVASLNPPKAGNLTYTSNDTNIATVDEYGVVTAKGNGTALITVSFPGNKDYAAAENKTLTVTVSEKPAIPTNITLNTTSLNLIIGDNGTIIASLNPPEAGNLTYTSNDTKIATVDENGIVTAKGNGTALITVSFPGNKDYAAAKNKTVTVTVNLKDASVSVNNNTLDLKVKDNFTIIAETTPDGLNVTYTSSNESVATVDAQGNVKAVGAGTAIITVSVGGDGTYALNTTTVTVTVNKIPTEINITNTTVTLNVDDEISTGATLTPADAGNLTYTSSNPDVAIVENGMIKALKEGTAIITVSFNGNDKYAPAENKTIFVTVSKIPTNITIDNSTLNLNVGDSVLTGATLYPVGAGNLTYTSSNSDVAIVENGMIKALKEGIAIITVSFNGNEKYASADDKFIIVHITKMNPIVNATSISFIVGNEGILNIYGPKDEYGYLNVTINNIIYQTIIKDGIASLNVSNLDIGVYTVDILYAENARYYQKEFTNAAQIIVFDKFPTPLNVDDLSIHVDDIAVINVYGLPNSLNGRNITITINNKTQIAIISDGNASSSFSDLTAGTYEIIVSYDGDNIYKANSTKANLTVNKISPNVNADDIEFKLGNEGILKITGPNDREGNLFINIGDNTYKATLINGEAKINVSHLNIGTYTVDIVYLENDKYYGEEFPNIAQITVIDKFPTPLKVDDLNINIGEDANIRVYNIPEDLNGKIITIAIEGVGSHFAVIRNGEAYSTFRGLTKTSYVIVASYSGDDNYKANSTKAILNVIKFIPKVSASNVTFIIGNEATLNIIGPDDYPGNLNITIGNNTYTATLINGSANINISDLGVGQYNVNILYLENDKYYEWYFENIATINVLDKIPTPLKIDDLTINTGEIADINVTVPLSINGQSIIISVNSKVVESIIINGIANAKFSDLPDGQYPIIAYYPGDSTHAANMTVATLNVNPKEKENATISIDAPTEAIEGNNVPVTVTLPEDATGTVTIGNEAVPIINGTAKTVLTNIPAGNTTVPITYSGDNKYNPIETEISINVKESINIDAPDVTKYYHGPERLVITVTDSEGTPIANKPVSIIINGVTNNRTTNAKGTTSIAINLPSNLYNATITVDNKSINSVILVLPTVNGTDLVKVFRNATQYYATFLDSEGNYLQEGSMVRFNINGVMYDRKVTSNGLAKLNINLEQGEYIITAMNPETGEMASNKITVIPRIIENNDLTKYYRNASQYTVKIIGDDGKAVGAGVTVTFNINGVFYTRQTNASGIAKLNINLEPGTYIITAEYQGCKVSNIIQVLPVLTAADMVKNYDTPDQFVATVVNGEGYPYAGQTVHFNIHGVLYTRITDIIGQARLNINLQPGEYIITSSYNGSSISNKITIIGWD